MMSAAEFESVKKNSCLPVVLPQCMKASGFFALSCLKTVASLLFCGATLILTGCASPMRVDSLPDYPSGTPTGARTEIPGTPTKTGAPLPTVEIAAPVTLIKTIDLISDANDVFQRIRYGFAMPDIYTDLVLTQQQWYLNRPDYLRRMVDRATPFLHYIVEEIDRRGMPMELALLPMVESAYNPTAYSRAKACGLWQFIPATGKRYNLDQNWWKDERRDIIASTTAALEYLQAIYEMHGDWHLALASYNWGEGAVARAVSRNQAKGLPTDYLSLSMPDETRNYVPKLQALKNIFSSPGLLAELGIPRIPNRPYFATVSAPENIDIKLAAQFAEIPVQEFVALNPAHHRPVITPDSPMVIPAEKFETFVNNLEAHEENNKPLSAWQTYTLRPGDRLESVAPRFGMTVANLKAVNGIQGKIGPGQILLVNNREYDGKPNMMPLPGQPRLQQATQPATTRTQAARKGEALKPPSALKTKPVPAKGKPAIKGKADNKKTDNKSAPSKKTGATPPPSSRTAKSAPSQKPAPQQTGGGKDKAKKPAGKTTKERK